jgi:hypothetical protein
MIPTKVESITESLALATSDITCGEGTEGFRNISPIDMVDTAKEVSHPDLPLETPMQSSASAEMICM